MARQLRHELFAIVTLHFDHSDVAPLFDRVGQWERSRGDRCKNPRISIELINLRPFYILGEVEKRGSYPYVTGLTVAQAVALANGYTYRASRTRITIQHAGGKEEPATEDTPVLPGDVVRVPERFF